MKTYFFVLTFSFSVLSSHLSFAQSDSLGMLGDQLDLYGVLDLFKNSDNLEEFEKKLNSEDNEVNNLDLNDDGRIDYIRVVDYQDGKGHAIVLQVPVSETESQDVAVIELDNTSDGVAHIQIVGDEDLYGKNYIVEPLDEKQSATVTNTTVVVNVWHWRPVHYFYGPTYSVWVSPWRWGYYPGWWRPWRPVGWYVYHPRLVRYHPYARVVVVRRSPRIYTTVYAQRRVTSRVVVTNRVRPAYYNRNAGPKTNTGSSTGRNGSNNAGPSRNNKVSNGSNNAVNKKPQRQERSQDVNTNKEQRRARKQSANPGQEGGRHQRMREGGRGNHERHAGGGGGGRGRRVR